jgi:hypothetical protein
VVDENNPPQQIASARLADSLRDTRPLSGRQVELQPQQVEAPRTMPARSEAVTRRMNSSVVMRRAPDPVPADPTGDATRSVERGTPAQRGPGRAVEGEAGRTTSDRVVAPRVNGESATPNDRSRTGFADGENRQLERSRRTPEFRPVERPVAPAPSARRAASEDASEINRVFGGNRSVDRNSGRGVENSGDNNRGADRNVERGSERRIERTEPPRSREPYSAPRHEDNSRPIHTPRRVDPPADRPRYEPRYEPREAPRQRPVERSIERPTERRADPPPARTERPSSPPPAERSRPAENSGGERGRGRPVNPQ